MYIIRLKLFLKQYKNLWNWLKAFKYFLNVVLYPFYKLHSPLFILSFTLKHKIDKSKYLLFAYGSIGDTFYMASLLKAFADKYGYTKVIASNVHSDIYRIFPTDININFLFLRESQCIRLRKALSFTRYYEKKGLKPGIIRPLHLVLYRNFYELVIADRLYYRDAITWVMGLDINTPYNYVSYSDSDKNMATSILKKIEEDTGSIALINPICYTHRNITVNTWLGIANALIANGYKPVFNVKRNPNDKNQHNIVPAGFPVVEIPAYLVPACADLVGIGCARYGGGFDLLQSFSDENNQSLLIVLSPKVRLEEFEKPDPAFEITEKFIKKFSGRFSTNVVLLDTDNDGQESYSKTIKALQYHSNLQE